MSKSGYISRYTLIVKKLQEEKYPSLKDLVEYVSTQLEKIQLKDEQFNIGTSERTIVRDIKELRYHHGFKIEFDAKKGGYYINDTHDEINRQLQILEGFGVFHSLSLYQHIAPYIFMEKRKPSGTENLTGLLYCIENKFKASFSYQKYWDAKPTDRVAHPYALREFKSRWYLLAKDEKDAVIKTFALDRITELDITNKKFPADKNFNAQQYFENSFGIISADGKAPQEIILRFDEHQGKYIKSLPLHTSQQIIEEDDAFLTIKLHLCITHDFVMELLSYGEEVKVIKPASLITQIKEIYANALKQYED